MFKDKKIFKFIILVAFLCFSDLISKVFVFNWLDNNLLPYKIFSGLNFVKVYNYGISFGIGQMYIWGKLFYPFLSILICLYLIIQYSNTKYSRMSFCAYSMIIGGALGNVVDRIMVGAVRDFIDVYIYDYHWPAFNLADSYICIGVVILIYLEVMLLREVKNEKNMV